MIKNAIVTGGAGFIGINLVRRLVARGMNVFVIDDFSTHSNPKYTELDWSRTGKGGISFSNGRVQSHSTYKFRVNPPDVIFHLAGKVGPVGVLKFKGQIADDTITSAMTVASWAWEFKCPLIDISTSEVYGDDTHSNSEADYPVIKQASARSEYAVAKLAAEHALLNMDKLDVRIVRPFNISGYAQRIEGGFVLPRFVRQAFSGEALTVYAPGTQQRSFTHVDDFIDGLSIVLKDGESGQIYNIGNPHNKISMEHLAHQVITRIGSDSKVEIVDPVSIHGPDFKEAPDKIPNNDKMRRLGWWPYRGTGEVIQDVIRYYKEQDVTRTSLRFSDSKQARPDAKDARLF